MRARLAVVIFLGVNSAFGQTVSDIDMKYGQPTRAYSVSEHIWMTPEYTVDGQVCMMRLYPRRIGPKADYLYKQLPLEELKSVQALVSKIYCGS